MSVKSFFFGYALISGDRKDLESVINICSENAIHFSGIALDDDSFTFRVDLAHHKKLLKLALNAKIELHLISLKGIPSLLCRRGLKAPGYAGKIFHALCPHVGRGAYGQAIRVPRFSMVPAASPHAGSPFGG